ncbi:MAG: AraC family transcriptional regulator [Phycisphaeraceae bacterium]
MRTKPREVYAGAALLLPELAMLGTDAPRAAGQAGLGTHAHRDAWELCYIADGEVAWWAGGQVHEVGPGHVYITRPGEPHGGVDAVLHPCELYWVQLRVPRRGALPGLARRDAQVMLGRLEALRLRCFPASDVVPEAFARLIAEHRQRDELSPAAARAALHTLLTAVVRDHARHRAAQSRSGRRISRAIRAAIDQFERDPGAAVWELAEHAGLSVTRFHERFRAEVGLTPADWRNRRRVDRAKQLLRSGRSVTEVAMLLAFSTSQYFATVFKRHTGLTPGQYRQRMGVDER